jgi:hypothetical protein
MDEIDVIVTASLESSSWLVKTDTSLRISNGFFSFRLCFVTLAFLLSFSRPCATTSRDHGTATFSSRARRGIARHRERQGCLRYHVVPRRYVRGSTTCVLPNLFMSR